jgi:hypothetical protein
VCIKRSPYSVGVHFHWAKRFLRIVLQGYILLLSALGVCDLYSKDLVLCEENDELLFPLTTNTWGLEARAEVIYSIRRQCKHEQVLPNPHEEPNETEPSTEGVALRIVLRSARMICSRWILTGSLAWPPFEAAGWANAPC